MPNGAIDNMTTSESSLRQVRDLPSIVGKFVRDPVGSMRQPITFTWPAMLSLQAGLAVISGAFLGLLNQSFLDFILSLTLFPIASLLVSLLFSFFIFYFFRFFRATFLDFRRLHSITTLAVLPYFLLHLFSSFLPPIDLIGFLCAEVLLIVGLIEQFQLDRKTVLKLMISFTIPFFVIWSIAQYRSVMSKDTQISKWRMSKDWHTYQVQDKRHFL
jgi:hypothetical protein